MVVMLIAVALDARKGKTRAYRNPLRRGRATGRTHTGMWRQADSGGARAAKRARISINVSSVSGSMTYSRAAGT